MKISKYLLQFIFIGFYFLSTGQAYAVTYFCEPTKKSHPKMEEYADDYFEKHKISSKLEENEDKEFITRCSFEPSKGKETCDRLEVDKIVQSKVYREVVPSENKDELGLMKYVYIKKYYFFSGQFDFQIFPDLSFIENNGRGGILFGKCKVISP
jgi:hypothetical protein